jgi:hypothetical protein
MTKNFNVSDKEELRRALIASYESPVTIYVTKDIDFSDQKGKQNITIEEECKGVYIVGPATIRGVKFRFEKVAARIIFENIRLRVGANNLGEDEAQDAFYGDKCDYIKFTNCTFSDASDEVLSFDKCKKVKIHRCIIGDPLHIPTVNDEGEEYVHKEGKKGSHGLGMRCGSTKRLKITESLFANCMGRNPQLNNENMVKTKYNVDIIDCVMFNYGRRGFSYNHQEKHAVKGGKFVVDLKNNLFIPGPRTKKSGDDKAYEVVTETPDKSDFKIRKFETNRLMFYDKFDVIYDDKEFTVPNGKGLTIPIIYFLDQCGCRIPDNQDSNLKQFVYETYNKDKHVYDGYDDNPELWTLSGWRHY